VNLFFMPKAEDDLAEWRRLGSFRIVRLARKIENLWDALERGHVPAQATPLVHPTPGIFSITVAGRHRLVFAIERSDPYGEFFDPSKHEIEIEQVNVVVFSVRGAYWPDL
jgi:hypothetical protein